ncbi:hypothetical protein MWN34_10605 [Ancylobacter sp. 6x-1]|uniref:Uncharacterized protein n=1 Tax=Ancylobacter crimeensis TaxID=2579147 RepID=A0ABT0DBM4_9HYPH|nr:hypothetical protein [Ancylobacter crimeensis]MCK0197362.1 hypothetical protein [Ancylobacter crimeensis]
MSDKLHLISDSLSDFTVVDNRGNSVSIQLDGALAFEKIKEGSVTCNNGISGRDDGKAMVATVDGVEYRGDSYVNKPRPGIEPDGLSKALEKMGPVERLFTAAKLLVTGHVAVDLGDDKSPLQTQCDQVRKEADKGTKR